MSNATVSDALNTLDAFQLPGASVILTYFYILGHTGYIIMASIALWKIKSRYRLFHFVSGTYGTTIVPNSTDALLTYSLLFSLIDLPFCAYALKWQQDSATSKHWQLFFGCRFIPVILFLWSLLSATMCIWPIDAAKMRLPLLWNTCLILVPAAMIGSFIFAVNRADAVYASAWELHERLKRNIPSNAASLTKAQTETYLRIVELYRNATKATIVYAGVGICWSLFFVLGLLVVGSHTISQLTTQYFKTRNMVKQQKMANRSSASVELLEAGQSSAQNCSGPPTMAFARVLPDKSGSVDDHSGQAVDVEDSSQGHEVNTSAAKPASATTSGANEHQQHVAVLRQLRSLLVHATVQLFCIWGTSAGILILFSVIVAVQSQTLGNTMRTGRSSILSAAFQPQIIEQVLFHVLGNVYLGSVLHRIRKGSPTLLFPRQQKHGKGRHSREVDTSFIQEPQFADPDFCCNPPIVMVDEVKAGPSSRACGGTEGDSGRPSRTLWASRSIEAFRVNLRRMGSEKRLVVVRSLDNRRASTAGCIVTPEEVGVASFESVPRRSRATSDVRMSTQTPTTGESPDWTTMLLLRPGSEVRRASAASAATDGHDSNSNRLRAPT
ncbi:unnamed protein product [Tilletia controversa]|uniref:Uncharacterized protein n=3 Tax=Tilletia TaxID=13289 RepID=A0A8X7MWC0_9BASI|nr:hypothetical protein CF336_g2700 [Tilletia laevis]KAE8202001.1 hypothetical protein CF328_g2463 [Tilletia controversa]KAE8257824.1 hypothetical protein A4X03_0g4552 [Tilletia caries]KAE8206587.1 hypothetical protein CF335_g1773 [Tilletia laevis]KAE8249692.1 hypothetical protein A4X06_0g3118 [Tilletia controversa]